MTTRRTAWITAALLAGSASVAGAAGLAVSTGSLSVVRLTGAPAVSTCTVNPNADATVDENQATTNLGTATTLGVRSANAATKRRAFVRFNLTTCAIPATADVRSASLTLRVSSAPGSSRTYEVRRVTATWTETGVTYNAQPAVAASATTTYAMTSSTTSAAGSVLADVQAMVAGTATNHGWRVHDAVENANPAVQAAFHAREAGTASNRPALTVTWYP